ncbi:hypothetical protein ACOBR2_07285 [Telmatobacter bradus]|uniref:hypothetical protein n=1 Tax=Telmatobacter bradus TaxID=474953 RepID=UPI003B43863E
MRIRTILGLFLLLTLTIAPGSLWAAHNPADYPLRVHIFRHSGVSHYNWSDTLSDVDGEGRANLYENGQPRGFDFRYECESRLMNSVGYDTLPARWKKPNAELEVLLTDANKTCKFHVAMKDGVVYRKHDGEVQEGPADKFKAWMDKYQYDPEHGKNIPIKPEEPSASSLDPATFALRVHIFQHTGISHYAQPGQLEPNVVEGEGRANLYENSQPQAFDFSYKCPSRLLDSLSYDTYKARWLTPGRQLEILLPASDKTCAMTVALKGQLAYSSQNGAVDLQPATQFKVWMDKTQYDPEHGKELPVQSDAAAR